MVRMRNWSSNIRLEKLLLDCFYEHIAGLNVSVHDWVTPARPIARSWIRKSWINMVGSSITFISRFWKSHRYLWNSIRLSLSVFFNSYSLVCYSKSDLDRAFYDPLTFLRKTVQSLTWKRRYLWNFFIRNSSLLCFKWGFSQNVILKNPKVLRNRKGFASRLKLILVVKCWSSWTGGHGCRGPARAWIISDKQADQVFKNIKTIVESPGGTTNDVKLTFYLRCF